MFAFSFSSFYSDFLDPLNSRELVVGHVAITEPYFSLFYHDTDPLLEFKELMKRFQLR